MMRQLFIYYRIPKEHIDLGLSCARKLSQALFAQHLGSCQLFQREEADKPYFTLMEVISPSKGQTQDLKQFSAQIETLAADCFAALSNPPARHTEVFSAVDSETDGGEHR